MKLPDLDSLIRQLGQLGDLETVCSPERPPGSALVLEIEQFIERYRFLEQDPGYVTFLRRYAGAALASRDNTLSLDLFGFSDTVTLHLTRGEGATVSNDLLTFADLVIPLEANPSTSVSSIGCGFGFPATPVQRWGVYRIDDRGSRWFCETFLGWLERFVVAQGRLVD